MHARAREERIAEAQVDLIFRSATSGFVATFVVGAMVVVASWDTISHVALGVWLAVATGVSVLRFVSVRAYARRPAAASVTRWRNVFVAGALAAGACWGVFGSVLFPASSPLHHMIIGFALGGMVGGAAAYLSPVRVAFAAYALSAVLPFTLRLLATGDVADVSMGVMTLVFAASMVVTSRSVHATITENIALRIDKEDVAARLAAEQKRITHQSEDLERHARELAAAHEAALAGTRAKSAFLATMSHEIRTPLHAVIGMADLIEQTELSDEQREYVSTIHSSGESLLTLLSDILDFSKLEAGKVDVEEMVFDLRRCVDEAIDVVAPAAAKKGLELLCELSEQAPSRIRSDPTRLRQILLNLLSNAVKFTTKGDIVVSVDARPHAGGSPDDAELTIAVRDDGFGIPKEKLGRLFQSFSQVDASTTRQFGGTGLGLAICQALATMLGGRIDVVSEPGKGSTFTLTLRTKVVVAAKAEEDAASLAAVRGAKVALFGTHAGVRAQLEQWLGRWGADVVAEDFDVAILDVGATAEGATAVARLRGVGVATPIIALLPLGEPHVVSELGRVGVIPVTKPAKLPRLLRVLARAVSGGPSLASTGAGSSAVVRAVSPRTLRVLVAEDNEVNQVVEKRMLEQLGHTVDIAENGLQAIAALRARTYDVVLLDMQMPELDGLATAARIVDEWPRASRPRLVALTANAMSGDRERCLAAGMDDYLTKPIRRQALEAALRAAPASDAVGASAPIPTTQSGLLDREVIDDLRALEALGGKSVLKEMVDVFLRDAPVTIAAVEAAVSASDLPGAARGAHKLKGSAAALGVYRVAFVASGIEDAAASGDLDAATQGARSLTSALEAVEPALRHLGATPVITPGRAQEGQ